MNPILLRYVAVAIIAAIFGVGGGYLAVNNKNERPTPQSGTTVAIPAQPFPGQSIPAIPAIPAEMKKPKTENSIFIHSPAGSVGWVRGQAFAPMHIEWSWNLKGNVQDFDINLLKDGKFHKKLATVNTKGQQTTSWSWEWNIPSDLPTGGDYNIEVSTTIGKQKISYINNHPFAILGETVTVKGKFIDKYTKALVSGVTMVDYFDQSDRTSVNSNGEFAYTIPTKLLGKTYSYGAACYMQGWVATGYMLGGSSIPTDPLTSNYNSYDLYTKTQWVWWNYHLSPILGDTANVDVGLWPAANIQITSDVPVKSVLAYSSSDVSYAQMPDWLFDYNTDVTYALAKYATTHLFENMMPADYSIRVLLMDQAGNKYVSPFYTIGSDSKCKTMNLNFSGGEFRWGN